MVKNNLASLTVVAILLVAVVHQTDAQVCNLFSLSPCLGTALFFIPPSGVCCRRLRDQVPCLCMYTQGMGYGQLLESGARRVAQGCGVVLPPCYIK
ncbi:putative non-specific lipid-transfer protein type 2 [Helianthus annuus]|uniref:Non-specific lipid-transfer protein type 2 n=1 Tax=Helianthus annuus TaxID=4232 RepID=A0A9K3E9A2_HELAN|nr:putative non-specific lipid-transfer protein type 2 [Helianthus annuus]KAJ0464011.1 putative non-specific lipid-transfer protein type 2 [Helianthus annuus]KAJ0485548.1 putative non-specific lipid-transfer protein type 2 [Helianthus annuus]KAJ0656100.1 putative non-specific lipid-transfer protein type 2 [Helianthus annuus]KAJ0703430.1 putative non-specific lipid-transfer protein type 2 [Helianthus annuus]